MPDNEQDRTGTETDDLVARTELREAWFDAFVEPTVFINAAIELFQSYLFSREWRRAWPGLVLLMLFVPILITACLGSYSSKETLLKRYATWSEEAKSLHDLVAPSATNEPQVPPPSANMAYSDMLYRRLSQLNDSNPQTLYMIALQFAREGRIRHAQRLMSKIALGTQGGYGRAHVWLAANLMQRSSLNLQEQRSLANHLEKACALVDCPVPLQVAYSSLLAGQGKPREAVGVLTKAAEQSPELLTPLSILARQAKMETVADEAMKKSRLRLEAIIESGVPTVRVFRDLVTLQTQVGEFEGALETIRKARKLLKDDADELRLYASEALRALYRKSIKQDGSLVQMDLSLLEAALKECPENPAIAIELAMLDELGVAAPESFQKAFEAQLLNGNASGIAHFVMGIRLIKSGEISKAIPSFELALKRAPNAPFILNNLALAIAKTDSTQIDRAKTLIQQAIAIAPKNAEYLDTQGQIYMISGDTINAISSLEECISIDPRRIQTRVLLKEAYTKLGMKELAQSQAEEVKKLEAQQK